MNISTHVIDSTTGKGALSLPVTLELYAGHGQWTESGTGVTNSEGRVPGLLGKGAALKAGRYRLTVQTASYFDQRGLGILYPYVLIVFEVNDDRHNTHVDLFLSPFGYSVYRGEV